MRAFLAVMALIGGGVATVWYTAHDPSEVRAEAPGEEGAGSVDLRSGPLDPTAGRPDRGTERMVLPTPEGNTLAVGTEDAAPASRRLLLDTGDRPAVAPIPRPGPRKPRLSSSQLRERAKTRDTASLVADLRDDDVRWNATAAGRELQRRLTDPGEAEVTRWHLEEALYSDDDQQRRIVTGMLHRLANEGASFSPTAQLLDNTVELLDRWDHYYDHAWIPGDATDWNTAQFALQHLELLETRIVRRLPRAADGGKFIHAYLLAKGGLAQHADLAVPVLLEHLQDNGIRDDALMSMEALFALGDAAVPWIEAALPTDDVQERACLRLLLLELAGPPRSAVERRERAALNVVTWKYKDPVRSWRYVVR